MGAGRPVVATRVGGVPDLIEHGEHGLLVPAGDPAELASAIARLIEDRDLAARLGAAARDRQRAELSLDAMLTRLTALYSELYGRVEVSSSYRVPPLSWRDRLARLGGA